VNELLWQIPLLATVGVVAGILNILAGGGSLLTLPVLLFMGLPAATANGTNRVAIFVQNIFAIGGFRKQGVFPWRFALICTAPALIGAWFGANLAVDIDDQLFKRLLALIMLAVLVFTAWDPFRRMQQSEPQLTPLRLLVLVVSFFLVGIYGGFVQAGVGFIVISALLAHGLDLVRINAIKVIVIFFFTMVALAVFVAHGQVDWTLGLSLAIGNAIGGWIGTHLAVKKGHDWIKRIVSLTVVIFALKLLFS